MRLIASLTTRVSWSATNALRANPGRSSGCPPRYTPRISRIGSAAASTASSGCRRLEGIGPADYGSDPEEAPQRNARASGGYGYRAAHQDRDQQREGDHVRLGDQLDRVGERIDERDLRQREQTDRRGAADRAEEQPLQHE